MNMIFPERRRGRRYLTLKNAAITGIALVVAFILLSIWSEWRPAHSGASGNLFEPRVLSSESPSAHREAVAIVQEGWIDDHPGANSILLDANTTPADVSIAATTTSGARQETFEHRESQLGKGKRIMISQGTDGVQMHVETAPAPRSTENTETAAAVLRLHQRRP